MTTRSGLRRYRSTTLVQVLTDEGLTGIGSCSGNGELVEVIVARVIKPLVVGMNPADIDAVWERAYIRGGHKEFGTRGVGVVALSGVDMALWDLAGKSRGVPLYELLGGKRRDRVPVYATALYPEEPAEVAAKARRLAGEGFAGIKIKVGFDLERDIRIVGAVRSELGNEYPLMVDANQGYSNGAALTAARAFAEAGVVWFEEPLFAEDIEGHARLRRAGGVPIAVGENLHTCFAFENFVVRGAIDYLQPDVARVGGITEVRKVASLAMKHGLGLSLHTWGDGVALAASLQLTAALDPCTLPMELDITHNPLVTALLREPMKVDRGTMAVGARPGLGVEVDPTALREFSWTGSEELAVHLQTVR
ncbi:MAG TPA: mandelate racemase/muconate lactonizing enzyme family protein [candidate division Zixibacteria bacterium]|nr:mandelate racemase/muconate lactonizing enzyme family protein [candidate division Zixibacteria bacterium]